MRTKDCKDCGENYPETREYFGQYKNKRNGVTKIGFRNSCRKCMAARTSEYDRLNPESVLGRRQRRALNEDIAGGYLSDEEFERIRVALGDCCRYCGEPLYRGGHLDHLTPVSRGGSHNSNNVTLACRSCNLEKGNKTFDEYIEWRRERNLAIRDIVVEGEAPDEAASNPRKN